MSAFIERDTFVNQLLQFIQLLLPDFQKPDAERLIMNPLDLRLVDINRILPSRDDELHRNLFPGLDDQTALDPGAAEREIDGLALDFVRVRFEQAFDLRRNPTVLSSLHMLLQYLFRRRKARQTCPKSMIVRVFP